MAQINSKLTPSGSVTTPASGSVAFFTEAGDAGRLYIKDSNGNVYPAASGSGGGSSLIPIQNDGSSVGSASTLNFSGSAVENIAVAGGIATFTFVTGSASGSGSSGSSGVSGDNGSSGSSGVSGDNGSSGSSGADGTSGSSGANGTSGSSGADGTSGSSGADGAAGTSGIDGTSGSSGADGTSGSSGADGTSGSSGADGAAGTSGSSGADGAAGTSGSSGESGSSGVSGSSGESGTSGETGTSGSSGADGAAGTSGSSGADGAAGTSGSSGGQGIQGNPGTSGSSGADGTSGSSGANGTSGSSGGQGIQGNPGTSGSSGADGAAGTSGSSGGAGAAGTSGSSGADGAAGTSGSSGGAGASGTAGTSGASGSSGTSAAGGGGASFNPVIRYQVTGGDNTVTVMSSGNVEGGLSWTRSSTTLTVTDNSHGLSAGDFVVIRNMSEDYSYLEIQSVTTNTFTLTVANSGGTSGTAGAYIPAFDISSLTDTALTLVSPAAGNAQLISLTHFIDTMSDTSVTVTLPSNALSNGAGGNNSLATRVPPQVRAHDLSGGTASNIGNTVVQFSTTANHNVYTVTGGLDIFADVIYNLQF